MHNCPPPPPNRLSFKNTELFPQIEGNCRLIVRHCARNQMHPPLTLHRHPMCADIIKQFQKCHTDHPVAKFFGECTELKIKLDRCFRQEKAIKRKVNFEESKKFKEKLQAYKKEMTAQVSE